MILYDSGVILASTRGFAELVGYSFSEMPLQGCLADLVVKDFSHLLQTKEENEIFQYLIPQTVNYVSMRFVVIPIKSHVFKFLMASSNAEEVGKWNLKQAHNFDDIKEVFAIPLLPSNPGGKRGILRLGKQRNEKNLKVRFNIVDTVHILEETDFKSGKRTAAKAKDATEIKGAKKDKNPEEIKEPSLADKSADPSVVLEFLDLKDLESSVLRDRNGSSLGTNKEESIVKRSAASVASSVQSSNASFTSSPEAQKLLTGVTSSMRSFKIAFFLTVRPIQICLVNVAMVAIIVYLKLASTIYIDTLDIKDLAIRRSLMANITSWARDLELKGLAQEFYDESSIRYLLNADISQFQSIVWHIEDKISTWDSTTQEYYNSALQPTWSLVGNSAQKTEKNLMNIMKDFISRAQAISNTSIPNIDSNNTDLYYLYRNGLSESLQAVNQSLYIFSAQQEGITNNLLLIVLMLALAAIVLLVLCFALVILPTLFYVERSNETVWKLFYLLPLDFVQEMRSRSEDRLETMHGLDPEPPSDNKKFKNLTSRKGIKVQKKWPIILSSISIYYLLSIAMFIFFYYYAYLNFGALLKNKPSIVSTACQRRFEANTAYFWLQELKYYNSSLSFLRETPVFRYNTMPALELDYSIEQLEYCEYLLIYGDLSEMGKSSLHNEYIWDSQCLSANCSLLAKGFHAGVLVYIDEVLDIRGKILAGKNPDLSGVFAKKNELIYGGQVLLDMYDVDMTTQIQVTIDTVVWVTSIYCILVTAMYFFIYIPIINSVKDEVTKVWKLGRLIPIEQRNKIMSAFKEAIKR